MKNKVLFIICLFMLLSGTFTSSVFSQLEKEVNILKKFRLEPEKYKFIKDFNISRLPLIEKLNLSEEQIKQFKKIQFDLEKKQAEVRAKLETVNIELKELLSAEDLDRISIEKKLKEIAELKSRLHLIRLDNWFAVNKILTNEQQKTWKKFLEKHLYREIYKKTKIIDKLFMKFPFMEMFGEHYDCCN